MNIRPSRREVIEVTILIVLILAMLFPVPLVRPW